MKAKWIVDSKYTTKEEAKKYFTSIGDNPKDYDIPEFHNVEISVVRENNELGIKSYGQDNLDKVILFRGRNNDYTKEDIKWCKQVAKITCEALNKNKL